MMIDLSPINSKTICLYPFMGLSTTPAGFMRPCCLFADHITDQHDQLARVDTHSIHKIWNGTYLRSLRKKIVSGEMHPGCRQCYHEEASGPNSMRFRAYREYFHDKKLIEHIERAISDDFKMHIGPRFLELKPGNTCNFKCRICSQYDSSQVANEIQRLAKKYSYPNHHPRLFDDSFFVKGFNVGKMANWNLCNRFWEEVQDILPHVIRLSIAGGEPRLISRVDQLLEYCVNSGHSKHISVYYSTNLSGISHNLLNLSSSFAQFEYGSSMDGVNTVQEYIRHNSKWTDIDQNYRCLVDNSRENKSIVFCNLTLQVYNILNFCDLFEYIDTFERQYQCFTGWPYNINILYEPRYLYIGNLPAQIKDLACKRINNFMANSIILKKFPHIKGSFETVLNILKSPLPPDYSTQLQTFKKFTELLDHERGENFSQSIPELHKYLQPYLNKL